MDRNTLLLGDATRDSRIIEIGPSHAPIAPKRAGWNSFVVDHADQAELRAKYRAERERVLKAQGLTEASYGELTRRISSDDAARLAFEAALAKVTAK